MLPPKPVDNCILFLERRIRETRSEKFQNLESFKIGLLLGIEAGIKQAKREFDINMIEFKTEENQ